MSSISIVQNSCVGCRNCEVVCPVNAISFIHNKEGFLYPIVNEDECCNCSKCILKCPSFTNEEDYIKCKKAYEAITKKRTIYKKAASGGVFSSVAMFFFEKYEKVAVVGAAYDKENHAVNHIIIDNEKDLNKVQGSKYVQSDLKDISKKILAKLSDGYKVIFSGTPCQVMAIKKIIPDILQDDIFYIDLVCHGTPSPDFLKKDLEWNSGNKEISDITFRKKSKWCNSKSEFFLTIFNNKIRKTFSYKSDVYYNLFMKGMTFRESCYICNFAKSDRVGDITIGDCDSAHLYKNFYPDFATSLLMINTDKGASIISMMEDYIEMHEIDLNEEKNYNSQLKKPFERPSERDYIYDDIENDDMEALVSKYARRTSITEKIGIVVFDYIPRKCINLALNLLKRKG